ncbi:trypsin-like peptidase domain-containing protein [Bythopirellula goksoeyrii]|uniref:trypsin-like peptidase domain-containing protein n=1 Tax=Bythopirellula goksoeyrii TaxID=1400387 RepID=UPI00143D9A4E|nr:trypsin-like peptidase domain-containing protein [Bythopirellula goksoeyrii]
MLPAVVTIEVLRGPRNLPNWRSLSNHPEKSFATENASESLGSTFIPQDGSGTGLIIDHRGFILTCNHVVDSAETIFVRLSDGRKYESLKVFSDPVTDLAVIQIPKDDSLTVAQLGNSDNLEIGDWVVSIGNPYELGLSVSTGIISATDRLLPTAPRTPLLQTDAASNPGNSGGPIINLQGQVVGISEGGYGSHEGFQGIGLAIPINTAKQIAQRLIEDGKVTHAQLGFDTEPIESRVAEYLGLNHNEGLLVCAVKPHSAVARAGMQVGDVVTRMCDVPIRNSRDIVRAIEKATPQIPLSLEVFRDGSILKIKFIPELLDVNNHSAPQQNTPHQTSNGFVDTMYGLVVDELASVETEKLGYSDDLEGIVVTYVFPQGVAAKEGVSAGMIIMRVDKTTVTSLADYQRAINDKSSEIGILALLATPQQKHFVLLKSGDNEDLR